MFDVPPWTTFMLYGRRQAWSLGLDLSHRRHPMRHGALERAFATASFPYAFLYLSARTTLGVSAERASL